MREPMDILKTCGVIGELVAEVTQERIRQISEEGYSLEHDDGHDSGELAGAAAAFALAAAAQASGVRDVTAAPPMWPDEWGPQAWKPKDARRNLIRAGALILAELQRIDRAAKG